MASPAYEALRKQLQPGLAIASDSWEVARAKMIAVHPTEYPDDVTVERLELGGVQSAWVSTPESEASNRSMLFVHGGAFFATGIIHYIPYAASLSRRFRARMLIFEYRLAPEHPFPAALDDTVAVFRAALAAGLVPDRTGFVGDSCGGGIAVAALCALRDAGAALPACFIGLTPWFDAAQTGDSAVNPRGMDPYVEAAWIRKRFETYAGAGGDLRDPRLSPIEANLTGLPPFYLGVGQIDTTCDDSTRLATNCGRDGVAVTLDISPEMIHGFHGLCGLFPEADAGVERAGEFVRTQLP